MSASPPRPLRRLLEWALPPEVQDGIVGDLDEVYRSRRSRAGALRTTLWYLGQVLAISTRFAFERVGDALATRGFSIGLDLKLGLRMLFKYPMLTVIGGIAITVATAVGVGVSEFVRDLVAPSLPFEQGDRIVRLYQSDAEAGGTAPASLYDLSVWRESIASLDVLGGYTTLEQGIVTDRGEAGSLDLARISASAFEIAETPPLIGRFLIESDENPDAEHVVVLGYQPWQRLLDGDPDPVGRVVKLGGTPTTIVGVMPEGFGFPSSENAWVPLRMDAAAMRPESAPRVGMFGRLAPGATVESAQTELDVAGRRAAADHPDVYERLRPQVAGFADRAPGGLMALIMTAVRLLFIFFLIVACANVATLVFARTVMRQGEIAIRTSLGATRRRIVLQLFAEALVLVGGSTLLGLVIARVALGSVGRLFFTIQQAPQPPFWWDESLSPTTIAYALVLALVGAFMVGVVPALKATRGDVQPHLGELSAGGGGGLRFGGMWTVIIVLQVALSVAFLPLAVSQSAVAFENPDDSGFPAETYLTAQLGRDPSVPPSTPEEQAEFHAASRRMFEEARDRIAADPAVEGAALASGLSAMNHIGGPVEFVGGGDDPARTVYSRILLVDRSYLDLVGATIVRGQPLAPGDFTPGSRSVVVNQAFVDNALNGRNPVGAQLRFPEREPGSESSLVDVFEAGSTVQIVGVVRNPGIDEYGPGAHAAIYAPLELAPVTPQSVGLVGMPQPPATQLILRLRQEGGTLPGLYATISGVDPSLRLSEVGTAADAWGPAHVGARIAGWVLIGVAGIVLMLSVAGIYALMSFTVSRRTREIAIRSAIGAHQSQIVRRVFRRAAFQLLGGVLLGSAIAVPVLWDGIADDGPRTLVIVAGLLIAAGLIACTIPVRRALAIEPASAMKAE